MKDVAILIPAYNPSNKLKKLVDDLKEYEIGKILIINDGSDSRHNKIFEELQKIDNIEVIGYSSNKGKGVALKYGINYYLENYKNKYKGIITVDADYQHAPTDIINVALRLLGNQDSLILGVRDFNSKKVPFASKFGNKLTSIVFNFLYGIKIKDTQTGLRGIPNRHLNLCLESSGKRFEYEMNMLIKFVKNKINILFVPINTIYYKKSESKFNRIIDSIIIYKAMLTEYIKYGLTSLCAAMVDLIIFTLFIKFFNTIDANLAIVIGTAIARIVSAFLNFNLTKYLVFDSKEKSEKIIGKFYLLNVCNMAISALLVLILHNLFPFVLETVFKVIVDTCIYFIGYKIQKKYIFKA